MKRRILGLIWLAFILAIFASPLVLAQGDETEPTKTEYVALLANSGLVAFVVQLAKWKFKPWLKDKVPYLIPIVGLALGVLGAWTMSEFGIDISAIGDVFGAGVASAALSSWGFAVVKEGHNAATGKLKKSGA